MVLNVLMGSIITHLIIFFHISHDYCGFQVHGLQYMYLDCCACQKITTNLIMYFKVNESLQFYQINDNQG